MMFFICIISVLCRTSQWHRIYGSRGSHSIMHLLNWWSVPSAKKWRKKSPWKLSPTKCIATTAIINKAADDELVKTKDENRGMRKLNGSFHSDMPTATEATVYPKKHAHGYCFDVLCFGYTLIDFPISIRLTSLALWQSNDCPSASKATLMNIDKYLMWNHYEILHNHNKAKHHKTVCIFLGIYCNACCRKLQEVDGDSLLISITI